MTQLQVAPEVSALLENWAGELISPNYIDLSTSLENASRTLADERLKAACSDMARRWRDGSGGDAIAGLMHRYHPDVFSEEVCLNVGWAVAIGEMQDLLPQIARGEVVLPPAEREMIAKELAWEEIKLAKIESGSLG